MNISEGGREPTAFIEVSNGSGTLMQKVENQCVRMKVKNQLDSYFRSLPIGGKIVPWSLGKAFKSAAGYMLPFFATTAENFFWSWPFLLGFC